MLVLAGIPALAAEPDWFPLATGNSWVYKGSGRLAGTDPRTIEVRERSTFDGHSYYNVLFFGRQVWLRLNEGRLLAWNPDTKGESLWIDFTARDGREFNTTIAPCNKSAAIDPKGNKYTGPYGEFDRAATVVFTPSCADAGYVSETYLPYIGMLQHVEETIGGPITFDLISSRTGLTEVAAGLVSFGVALDGKVYTAGGDLLAHMRLRNNSAGPIELVFPTGQDYDLVIRNEKGEEVYRWSTGKVFTQVVRKIRVESGAELNFVVTAPLKGLPPGKYVAQANLATENPSAYVASVGFEVAEVTTQK